jgi:mutator protein MutT
MTSSTGNESRPDPHASATTVAIAVVAHEGCYLVGRRGPNGPLAGYFEFPGGKCLPGESTEACAVRECREETGLAIEVVRLRRSAVHTYPYGKVQLHFFDCRLVPESLGRVSEPFFWVPANQIRSLKFPDPNGPLIEELGGGVGSGVQISILPAT